MSGLIDLGPAPTKKKFEQRMYRKDAPFIQNRNGTVSSHKMAWGSDEKGFYAFPTIIEQNGKLKELSAKEADEYAHKTGELKRFKTQAEVQAYAKGSWKKPKTKLIDLGPAPEKKKGLVDLGPAPTPIMEAVRDVEPIKQFDEETLAASWMDTSLLKKPEAVRRKPGMKSLRAIEGVTGEKPKPIGLGEAIKRADSLDIMESVPVPFNPFQGYRKWNYLESKKRLAENDYTKYAQPKYGMTPMGGYTMVRAKYTKKDDLSVVKEFEEWQKEVSTRGRTWPYAVAAGIRDVAPWIADIAISGGVRKGVTKTLDTAIKSKTLAKGAGLIANAVVASSLQPSRYADTLAQIKIEDPKLSDKDANIKAVKRLYIMNLSEMTGEFITRGAVKGAGWTLRKLPFTGKLLNKLSPVWQKITGGTAAEYARKISTATGVNSMFGEVGEERVETTLMAITNADDFGAGKDAGMMERVQAGWKQDAQNIGVELPVLMAPVGARYAASRILGAERPPAEAIEKPPSRPMAPPTKPEAVEVAPEAKLPRHTDKQAVIEWLQGEPTRPVVPEKAGKKQSFAINQLQMEWDRKFKAKQRISKRKPIPKQTAEERITKDIRTMETDEGKTIDVRNEDIISVVSDELQKEFGWPQTSKISEATYFETDEGKKVRVAAHSIVYGEDVDYFISIGKLPDADISILEDATVEEIKKVAQNAIEALAKPEAKVGKPRKPGRPLKELGGMPEKPPGLTKGEVEHLGAREQRALRAAQARGYPVGFKMAQRQAEDKMNSFKFQMRQKEVDFQKIKDEMFDVVKNALPTYERGKVNVMALLKSVSPEKSAKVNRKNLIRAIVMTSRYAEQANQRALRSQINKELAPKKIKPKKKEGILRGKFTADIQTKLNQIAAHINDDREQARLQIANTIAKYEEGKISYEDMRSANEQLSMRGIKGMTAAELERVLDNIRSLKEGGKTIREAEKEKEDARIEQIRSRTIDIVTGGVGIRPGAMTVPRKQLEVRKTPVEKIANWQYGWDNFLDKLSKYDTDSKMYQSDLSKFGAAVHEAHNRETTGVDEQIAKLFGEFQKIYNVKTPKEVNKILNSLKEEVDLGKFNNADNVPVRLKLTKEQLIKKYQELQDPTLEATFIGGVTEEGKIWGMRWTDEIINAVNKSLSPQEKAWADYQMQWYQEYYPSVNEVYRTIYHVDLPHNLYYSPIGRDIEADIPENVLLAKEGANYASTLTGSLKSRTANALPLRFRSADAVLINHILRMEHFKAWANTMRDMRRVFGDKKVRAAIRQYHGKGILRQIDVQLNQMARGGIEKAKINRYVDKLRRNFTLSILGVKPVIGLKQIPSVIAYSTEMPFGDFVSGVADFWTNPIKHTSFLRDNSPYFKQRWKAGFERDIRFAMKKGYAKRLASKGNVRDWFMSLIRAGDKFATMQGGWAKYQNALKEGKSQTEAIAAAEQSTKRTQPSFSLESLSPLQRGGSWMKLFTMFQNQPNKYFRIIADNARNMRFGRQTLHKGTANMLLAWVVLPCLFQFIADAFQFKKWHQLRAAVLGPINHLLILGQIAQQIWGWATKEPFDYQASPVFSTGRDLQLAVTKSAKIYRDGKNPYKDVNMDDLIKAVEYYGQAAGKLTGVPTPYAVQAERSAREIVSPTEEAEKRRKERMPGWRREPTAELVFSPWALKAADRVKAMTVVELRKAIEDNTYKRRYKRNGKWYPAGHPHKGREEFVEKCRVELKKKGATEPKRKQRLEREKKMLRRKR